MHKIIFCLFLLIFISGCSGYKIKTGDCKDIAAMSCLLEKDCSIALWYGNPGHVQAYTGDVWLSSGFGNGVFYVYESGKDVNKIPDKIYNRDEYLEWYMSYRKRHEGNKDE